MTEAHQESIAWLFLNNIIPIYEAWVASLKTETFPATNGNISPGAMKNPITAAGGGIVSEINKLTVSESQIIKDAFYSRYSNKKHRCFANLNNLLRKH